MIFSYDESGAPIAIHYRLIAIHYRLNGSAEDVFYTYYLEKNLQGDIIALYNSSGTKLVGYTYDAWGNCTTIYYNNGDSTGAQFNPFRYRGYYYDTGLELYYLNSRYYDSRTGRFINADKHINANGDIIGYNMYTYCSNNPVMETDQTGESWLKDKWNAFTNWLSSIFGASASVTNTAKLEYDASHPLSPITYSTGISETVTEQSYGDSSKPISVYANGEMENAVVSSSVGLKINIGKFTLKTPLALDNIGIYGSWNNEDTTVEYGLSVDISKLRIEGTQNITQGSTTQYTKAGVSGWFILVLIRVLQTGDASQLQPAYAH